jgi:hypothetical protein
VTVTLPTTAHVAIVVSGEPETRRATEHAGQ